MLNYRSCPKPPGKRSGFIPAIVLGFSVMVSGCGTQVQKPRDEARKDPVRVVQEKISATRITEPAGGQRFPEGSRIPVSLVPLADTIPSPDSVGFFFDGDLQTTLLEAPFKCELQSEGAGMGTKPIRIIAYHSGGRKEYHNLDIVILAGKAPVYIPYRIINTRPHDVGAYTQGLVFENGYLYEGTGQWKESSLRKTIISTGEAERILSLPDDIFGEGITIFGDRIYQLTYKSQVGFVYDKESFKRIQKVYYENKEGWGLTTDGENLIMSDGSHRIYFMDPEYFTEVRQIEVYDDKAPVSDLNELEYIEGRIFANIYLKEEIVIIDPSTGRVTGKLNMNGILPAADRHRKIDVFNGIAWDPGRRVLYVTGKYWPSLFEVSLQADF